MGNTPTRTVRYKPRYTFWEAYDLLDPRLKEAVSTAVIAFDAGSILRSQRKFGVLTTLYHLETANTQWAKHALIPACGVKGKKGYKEALPSTVVACGVPPLKTKWKAA